MNRPSQGMTAENIAAAAFRLREIGIVVALAAAIVFFSVRADNFFTVANWQNIATNVAMVVVVAVGETMVVLTRNIDLSVGSIVGLSAYISADTLADHHGTPIVLIALLAMGVGLACGIGNGLLVAVGRVPAIIATLATLAIYRGFTYEATGGGGDEHLRVPAPGQLPQPRGQEAARDPDARVDRARRRARRDGDAALGAVGTRLLCHRIEPGRRSPGGHPGRPGG